MTPLCSRFMIPADTDTPPAISCCLISVDFYLRIQPAHACRVVLSSSEFKVHNRTLSTHSPRHFNVPKFVLYWYQQPQGTGWFSAHPLYFRYITLLNSLKCRLRASRHLRGLMYQSPLQNRYIDAEQGGVNIYVDQKAEGSQHRLTRGKQAMRSGHHLIGTARHKPDSGNRNPSVAFRQTVIVCIKMDYMLISTCGLSAPATSETESSEQR
ncbi:hypothetical protein C8R45DRAFT_920296 [Mycena sanguinolenta]|nr:hypothetical protein C8R45DRAFT_920296 [Mycena sanguinolenta]